MATGEWYGGVPQIGRHFQLEKPVAHGRAEELTGRRRYRRDYHEAGPMVPFLVLQVEVSVFNTVAEGKPGKWVCEWRDATPADIAAEELV